MEKSEAAGNITVRSLRRAAQAMGCERVYAFVPREDLESIVREQVEKAAKENLKSISHTMSLEDQGLSADENAKLIAKLAADWTREPPRHMWDAK